MINITGDTADELAVLQTLLETGMINSNKDTILDITYKLSSGNILLVDQYNHIIGEKGQDCRDCKEFEDCPCGKDGHENGTSQGYSIGECKDFNPIESEEVIFNNLCNSCSNIGCEFQSGIIRTKCAFYMPPRIEPDNCGNYIVK